MKTHQVGSKVFKIEENIPIPVRTVYPFSDMKIGDSFLVLFDNDKKFRGLHTAAKRKNIKITIRREKDGYRVWRIA